MDTRDDRLTIVQYTLKIEFFQPLARLIALTLPSKRNLATLGRFDAVTLVEILP